MITHLLLSSLALLGGDAPTTTPATRKIDQVLHSIALDPAEPRNYAQLAFAQARRGRETADPVYYERALASVEVALALRPGDHHARTARAWALLGLHRFSEARVLAEKLNQEAPDDVLVYGLLTDACVELGDYDAAEAACQWMLDLRPGNVPGITRAAYLRELFGDLDGSFELMTQAYHSTPSHEVEDLAWIATHLAHLELQRGRDEEAGRLADHALELFPDYHYALATRAEVDAERGEHTAALEKLRRRYEVAPHPENLYAVGLAELAAGQTEAARESFDAFEDAALAESENLDNANLDLIEYWCDEVGGEDAATRALELARASFAMRGDVRTRVALARALFAVGEVAEAARTLEEALEVGLQDADLFELAARIQARLGNVEAAREAGRRSLGLRPRRPGAEELRGLLERLAD